MTFFIVRKEAEQLLQQNLRFSKKVLKLSLQNSHALSYVFLIRPMHRYFEAQDLLQKSRIRPHLSLNRVLQQNLQIFIRKIMHKKINKVKKDLDKGEKDVKKLLKADIKQDKIVEKAKHKLKHKKK